LFGSQIRGFLSLTIFAKRDKTGIVCVEPCRFHCGLPILIYRRPLQMSTLTPEEMLRIEQEEQRRHAEEQYRQEVRSRIQPAQPPSLPPVKTTSNKTFLKILLGVLCVVLAIVVISNVVANRAGALASIGGHVSKTDQIVLG
jgi:hypothetical protein